MTEEIKSIEHEDEHHEVDGPKYLVQLTLKSLIATGSIIISIIGGSFGVGVKVETEVAKIESAKLEQTYMQKFNDKDCALLESKRQCKEFEESSIFYKNQYLIQIDRLKKCEDGGIFTQMLNKE